MPSNSPHDHTILRVDSANVTWARRAGEWTRAQIGQEFAIDRTLAARQKPQGFIQDITMNAEGFSNMADPVMHVFLPGKPEPWRDIGKVTK